MLRRKSAAAGQFPVRYTATRQRQCRVVKAARTGAVRTEVQPGTASSVLIDGVGAGIQMAPGHSLSKCGRRREAVLHDPWKAQTLTEGRRLRAPHRHRVPYGKTIRACDARIVAAGFSLGVLLPIDKRAALAHQRCPRHHRSPPTVAHSLPLPSAQIPASDSPDDWGYSSRPRPASVLACRATARERRRVIVNVT